MWRAKTISLARSQGYVKGQNVNDFNHSAASKMIFARAVEQIFCLYTVLRGTVWVSGNLAHQMALQTECFHKLSYTGRCIIVFKWNVYIYFTKDPAKRLKSI